MAPDGRLIAALTFFVVALIQHSEGIQGGCEATPHSRPYMASIQIPSIENVTAEEANGTHECGGFLITDSWVMTAAHCFPAGPMGRIVVLGAHSLTESEITKQFFHILEVHKHPRFTYENFDSDIALIKLERPVEISEAVKPLKYLRAGETKPTTGAQVDTAGWGSIDNLGQRPDKLQEVFVEIFSSARCARGDYFGSKFTGNMMCAYKDCKTIACVTKDSCDGDSGGPLLYTGVAVGITSNGGKKCGQSKKPGVYTIISHFTQWIDEILAL